MQARSEGCSPSAETEVSEEIVTPARPPGPSVVATATKVAARLIPSRKAARRSMAFSSAQVEEAFQLHVRDAAAELIVLALPGRGEGLDEAGTKPVLGEIGPGQPFDRLGHRAGEIARGFLRIARADDLGVRLDLANDPGDTGGDGGGGGQVGVGI